MTDDVLNGDVHRRLADAEAALDAARDREAGLRESEERYRSLFYRMGQGYCELELLRDETGRAVDQRYIAFNPAFERLFGIPVAFATGRTASEVFPGLEPWWHEAFDRIARDGQPERIEHVVASLGRAFEVYVYPVGRDHLTVLYEDVTQRRRADDALRQSEERQGFLLKLSDALRALAGPADIQGETTRLLREHLNAGWCYYVDWDLDRKIGLVLRDSASEGLPSLAGAHDVSDAPEFLQLLAVGAVLTVRDYANYEQLPSRIRQKFVALGFRSMMVAPLVKEGRLIASLLVGDTDIRDWSASEVSLLVEVAERTWAAHERARAEAALRESEERFRALVTAGAYMLYRMSADWRQMHQLSGREFLADTPEPVEDWADTYLLSDDRPTIFAAIEGAIRSKTLFELEHRVRKADGSIGWVLSRAVPILNDAGDVVEWFGAASDVTERREAQEKVRRADEIYREALEHQVRMRTHELTASRDLFQATLDSSMDMIQVFEAVRDASGEIVDFRWILNNHASESLYGEVRGQSLLQRNPGVVQEGIFDAFKSVTETGVPVSAERHYVHEQFDGWFFQSAVKLDDGVATTTKDITDWKFAQMEVLRLQEEVAHARLRESEERLRQFGEASTDVLWIRDAETFQWSYLTPAFETIYGLDREAALRGDNMSSWLDMIVPEDRQTALDNIQRVRAGERAAFEYRIRRPSDDEVRWVRNTDFPMRDAAGQVCWLGGVGRDITDEKTSAQRLEVLINELQHRARNLLGVVTAVAGKTLRQGGSVDAFEERLQALSRAQALLSQAGSDMVEVGALVRAELAPHVHDGSERVRVGGPEVQLTARQVQNFALALHELTTNAVKYGALKVESARLVVTWDVAVDRREHRRLALSWIESGVAVEPEKITRRGYGTELIQEALAYALEADVDYVLDPDGVRCRIEMPIT